MQLKFAPLLLCFILSTAVAQQYHLGGGISGHENHHAGYNFEYGVKDPHTHDVHSQKEHREGDNVVGEYTLLEADGTQRIVKYRAGPHIGFEAYVERHGHAQHPGHYGKYGSEKGGPGGTSYVGPIHWNNQGHEDYGHH